MLKIGDKVKFVGGGPELTVTEILQTGQIMCMWWDESEGIFYRDTFPEEALAIQ